MSNKRKLEDNVEQLHIQKKRRLEPHLAPAQTCRTPVTDVSQDSQDNLENSNSFDNNINNVSMPIESEEFFTLEAPENVLPEEMWQHIFHYLPGLQLEVAGRACKRFREIILRDKLWEALAKEGWTNLRKDNQTWRQAYLSLRRPQQLAAIEFTDHKGWNRKPIFDKSRLKIYYFNLTDGIVEWDLRTKSYRVRKVEDNLLQFFKYNAAEVDTKTGHIFFVSCHTVIKVNPENFDAAEIVTWPNHGSTPQTPNTRTFKWNNFGQLQYLNGCAVDPCNRKAYLSAVCSGSIFILCVDMDEFLHEHSWQVVEVQFATMPDESHLSNLVVVADHRRPYVCYLNAGEKIYQINCHPAVHKVTSEMKVNKANKVWPGITLSEDAKSLFVIDAKDINVLPLGEDDLLQTPAITPLKNNQSTKYEQFDIKVSPCPGIDTKNKFAYFAIYRSNFNVGGTQQQKMTIAKVNIKTGKIRKVIILNDTQCNMIWVFFDEHAGLNGRLYLIGSRSSALSLLKVLDV